MGSGKTTVSKFLSRELKLPLFEEKPQENPFLELFYGDMERWALHSQLSFVLRRIQQNIRAKSTLPKTGVVHDSPLGQDMVYLKTNQKFGHIKNNESKLVKDVVALYKPQIILPDPLIFLDAPLSLILERIKGRGRSYEDSVPREYIATLYKFQKEWMRKYPKDKKIIVPMDKVDIKNEEGKRELRKIIKNYISQPKAGQPWAEK